MKGLYSPSDSEIVRSVMFIATLLEIVIVLVAGISGYILGKYHGVSTPPPANVYVSPIEKGQDKKVFLPVSGIMPLKEIADLFKKKNQK